MKIDKVLIIGNGIAGLSCAYLLASRGWEIEIWGKEQLFAPTLILNQITCNLLQDIWQLNPRFWHNLHLLQERRVCWQKNEEIAIVAESSLVINGKLFSDHLQEHLTDKYHDRVQFQKLPVSIDNLDDLRSEYSWIIDAGGRKSTIAQQLGAGNRNIFGNRCILAQGVELTNFAQEDIYWMETTSEGWLFLAPVGNNKAILQVMVPLISEKPFDLLSILVQQTKYIQNHIAEFSGTIAVFPAFPQILQPLSGNKYIAVGDAAFSVDPISGDGTGYAVRGAILATSIIDAIASGLSSNDCLEHYTLRLEKAFDAHLQQCLQYYMNGFTSSHWQEEIKRMQRAKEILNKKKNQNFIYSLKDFQLVKR